ncbi:hypothetical protein OIU84_018077 [Salix udensis]|uniref:Uncharacterized protein n=1 Tax=Salix udensis TaxID=889485 RepID=A0AAD6PLM7_9ROSI|nr:hypothetical protein OIU84_018077 [Salix udensis]
MLALTPYFGIYAFIDFEMNPEDEAEEDGANIDLDSQRKGKCVVLKTSTRQTIFLPVVGLVDPDKLKPGTCWSQQR